MGVKEGGDPLSRDVPTIRDPGTGKLPGVGEGTPYNGLYGDDPPEKGYFFQASGILGNLSFGLIKRLKRANRCISWLRQSPENVLVYDLSKFLRLNI